jgi:small subunit ribosomal protein S9
VPENWTFATGRRKTSIARVMIKGGDGKITVNGREPKDYFHTENNVVLINQPLEITNNQGKYDFKIIVKGGGISGQAGAVRHGIARALLQVDPDSKMALRKSGLLTRDSRMVERKKSGRPKARKRFQFSKR